MTHRPASADAAPILILHIDPTIRRMLKTLFEFEDYITHETGSGGEALRLLQAAESGMIVYLEPLFLRMPGNERLADYVTNRHERTPQVWILLASDYKIGQAMDRLRADSFLELPFTAAQALASVEDAQRFLQDKRAHADNTGE